MAYLTKSIIVLLGVPVVCVGMQLQEEQSSNIQPAIALFADRQVGNKLQNEQNIGKFDCLYHLVKGETEVLTVDGRKAQILSVIGIGDHIEGNVEQGEAASCFSCFRSCCIAPGVTKQVERFKDEVIEPLEEAFTLVRTNNPTLTVQGLKLYLGNHESYEPKKEFFDQLTKWEAFEIDGVRYINTGVIPFTLANISESQSDDLNAWFKKELDDIIAQQNQQKIPVVITGHFNWLGDHQDWYGDAPMEEKVLTPLRQFKEKGGEVVAIFNGHIHESGHQGEVLGTPVYLAGGKEFPIVHYDHPTKKSVVKFYAAAKALSGRYEAQEIVDLKVPADLTEETKDTCSWFKRCWNKKAVK